jgi:formylmethanofuran dehydrogenase subunit D
MHNETDMNLKSENRTRLSVLLVTGRTIEQGVSKEHGKGSEDYAENVAVCYLDPEDLKQLRIKEKTPVQVSTPHGSVVVRAIKSRRGPHPRLVFIPYGPWANAIADPETDSIGMPSLKGVPAEVEAAPDKSVMSLKELLRKQFGKETNASL